MTGGGTVLTPGLSWSVFVVVVVVRGVPMTVVDVVDVVVMSDSFVTAVFTVLVFCDGVMCAVDGISGHVRDPVQEAAERGCAFAYATMLAA